MRKFHEKMLVLMVISTCSFVCSGCIGNVSAPEAYSYNEDHPEIGKRVDIDVENEQFILKMTNIENQDMAFLYYSFGFLNYSYLYEQGLCDYQSVSGEETKESFYCTDAAGTRVAFTIHDGDYWAYEYAIGWGESKIFYLHYENVPEKVKSYILADGEGISLSVSGAWFANWRADRVSED